MPKTCFAIYCPFPAAADRKKRWRITLLKNCSMPGPTSVDPDRRRPSAQSHSAAKSGNLVFKMPGTIPGKRRLLSAHLDTVPLCVGARPVRRGDFLYPADKNTGLGADDRSWSGRDPGRRPGDSQTPPAASAAYVFLDGPGRNRALRRPSRQARAVGPPAIWPLISTAEAPKKSPSAQPADTAWKFKSAASPAMPAMLRNSA